MAAIAEQAGASLRTLYGTFSDKADVFEAVLGRYRLRMAAATLPAYRRASSPPEAIAAIVRAGLAYLDAEPAFARLITIDVYSAGGAALERRDEAIEAAQRLIETGLQNSDLDSPIAAEAIQGALYGMLAARVRSRKAGNLAGLAPLAIYMILAPFMGAEEAYRWATE
ncbi:MAG: TetR family transcriptional regulator [Solirubrobacterales bacterium]|nr:TetR family transcriptional regulator [Solirubrobacterales bacterium]